MDKTSQFGILTLHQWRSTEPHWNKKQRNSVSLDDSIEK